MDEIMIMVDGVAVATPSSFEWGLMDISPDESGRTDDMLMHKNRIGQKRKIQLSWAGKTWKECSVILKAFNPEYVMVRYPDVMSGTYETREFYVGDRSAPFKCFWVGNQRLESLSFDIIER